MDAFTFGIMGMIFGIIGLSLGTQANAKLVNVEERINKLEEAAKINRN